MKKLSVLTLASCIIFAFTATQSFAQDNAFSNSCPMPMEHKHHGKFNMGKEQPREDLAKLLNLTPEQKKQEKALREQTKTELKPIGEQIQSLMNQARAIHEKHLAEFEKILTPEQKTKFEQILKEKREKLEQRRIARQNKETK
jgi:Spy/CpxP family protein refolding chaperone